MDAHQLGILIGTVVVVIITGVVSFITGTKKSTSSNTQEVNAVTPLTVEYLTERERQYYDDFVAKEHYEDNRKNQDKKFEEFQGELKEIKKSQTSLTEKVNEINTSVQLTAKDIEYIKRSVDFLPKRQNDC